MISSADGIDMPDAGVQAGGGAMSETALRDGAAALQEMRRHKEMFDNTWTLSTVLAAALVVVSSYFGLAQLDIGPAIWTLAVMALAQLVISSLTIRAAQLGLQISALISQILGTVMMGVVWHLFGGLQQPLFPLLAVLPLLTGALLLGFWQQQAATAALVAVVLSGIVLTTHSPPDYDIMMMATVTVIAVALSALARVLVSLMRARDVAPDSRSASTRR